MVKQLKVRPALLAQTTTLGDAINAKVAAHGGPSVKQALQLQPALATSSPRGILWRLLQTDVTKRTSILLDMADRLTKALPAIMAKHPVRLVNLGFSSYTELIAYLIAGVSRMETSATTLAEFNKGIQGWRWNVAGRLLFERLVKFDPGLDSFFRGVAKDFFSRIHSGAGKTYVTLFDGEGKRRQITPTFRTIEKAVEFKLRGADGVIRSYTDFGFISKNQQGVWGALLIEIKMPSALSAVAEQFSEFLPRLKEAQEMIAVIVDDRGVTREERILPSNFVVLEHERGQIAIAPVSVGQGKKLQATMSITPSDVATVVDFSPAASQTHELFYYKVRVLILRDWLVDIVKAITD